MTNPPTDLLRCPLVESWRRSSAHEDMNKTESQVYQECADELASWLQTVEPKLKLPVEETMTRGMAKLKIIVVGLSLMAGIGVLWYAGLCILTLALDGWGGVHVVAPHWMITGSRVLGGVLLLSFILFLAHELGKWVLKERSEE